MCHCDWQRTGDGYHSTGYAGSYIAVPRRDLTQAEREEDPAHLAAVFAEREQSFSIATRAP